MKYLHLAFCLFLSASVFAEAAKIPTKEPAKATNSSQSNALKVSIPELRKLQLKLQEHKYLSMDFEQIIFKKLRKKTSKNKGEVHFRKPDSFHWKFSQADHEEWIYDGKTLFHYFPKKNIATRYKAQAAKGKNLREIVSIVLDFDSLLKRYSVVSSSQDKDLVKISLKPKDHGEISQVQLSLDTKLNYMREVKLNFEGGNHSTFAFSNPKHSEIKNTFSIPAPTKILDPM